MENEEQIDGLPASQPASDPLLDLDALGMPDDTFREELTRLDAQVEEVFEILASLKKGFQARLEQVPHDSEDAQRHRSEARVADAIAETRERVTREVTEELKARFELEKRAALEEAENRWQRRLEASREQWEAEQLELMAAHDLEVGAALDELREHLNQEFSERLEKALRRVRGASGEASGSSVVPPGRERTFARHEPGARVQMGQA